MGKINLLLRLDELDLKKFARKAKKLGFPTSQQYIYELMRRAVYEKHNGGRPKSRMLQDVDILTRKQIFAKRGGALID